MYATIYGKYIGRLYGKLTWSIYREAKVINHNYREDTRSGRLYREGNMISGQRGRGNNWALGYHGLNGETEETSLLHRAMETVRKEVERCDNYAGKGLDYWTHCSCVKVKVFLQA